MHAVTAGMHVAKHVRKCAYEYVCVLISDGVHRLNPWLSDFAHYPPLLFLC